MAYVDLWKRRFEAEGPREERGGPRHDAGHYPSMAVGAALGILFAAAHQNVPVFLVSGLPSGAPEVFAFVLLAFGGIWGFRRSSRTSVTPSPAKEHALLVAIREAGGITAVDAAIETSLTVDEADKVLSRLADRGHLFLESHDGALVYTLPGRRPR